MKVLDMCRCRIKLRSEYEGQPLKPNVLELNGKVFNLMCCWQIDEGERYSNEYALEPYRKDKAAVEAFENAGISWIASGDIKVITW